jgi:hypothetical protein
MMNFREQRLKGRRQLICANQFATVYPDGGFLVPSCGVVQTAIFVQR